MTLHKSMPTRLAWAIEQLASSAKAEGVHIVSATIFEGEPNHASLVDEDGNLSFFWYEGGEWVLQPEVGNE